MFNDISCDRKGNKDACLANAGVVKVLARRFGIGQWSFIGPGSENKWYSAENSPQGAWDNIAEEMLLEFAESGHPTFRATTPLSRGQLKSKGHGKLSIHFAADEFTIDTICRIILSVNHLSVYGAVAALCEEFESHQDGSGQPEILMGQSIVLHEVKAEALFHNENSMNDQIIWQHYIQQVESLSPESKVSKFCKEAGFMRVVEVGQHFVTKNTGDFRQFQTVACREYTLPRDDPASQPKGWIQGHMRIGPVLEVTTRFQHFKYGIGISIGSVNQDNSHSWVRFFYGRHHAFDIGRLGFGQRAEDTRRRTLRELGRQFGDDQSPAPRSCQEGGEGSGHPVFQVFGISGRFHRTFEDRGCQDPKLGGACRRCETRDEEIEGS